MSLEYLTIQLAYLEELHGQVYQDSRLSLQDGNVAVGAPDIGPEVLVKEVLHLIFLPSSEEVRHSGSQVLQAKQK